MSPLAPKGDPGGAHSMHYTYSIHIKQSVPYTVVLKREFSVKLANMFS